MNKESIIDIDKYWLNYAIDKAKKASSINEVPVGAVLVDRYNKKISSAYNKCIKNNDPCAHAEILTLKKAGKKLNNYRFPDTTLYVTLEPCPMCAGALIHARVKRIVYAAKDFRSGFCDTVLPLIRHKDLNHSIDSSFVESKEYISILQHFFRVRRKNK